jgi:hypothetical protein
MTRPQFRPTTRPLRPASYRAAVRRYRQLCDIIERYSDPKDSREKAQLARAIHGLAYGAKDLSARHRRATQGIGTREATSGGADPGRGVRET